MNYPIKSPRKLIEVALPLDAINVACAYEKMPGIGGTPTRDSPLVGTTAFSGGESGYLCAVGERPRVSTGWRF